MDEDRSGILPELPVDPIKSQLAVGRGNEIGSGKFCSPETSSAPVANAFGHFPEKADRIATAPHWTGREMEPDLRIA